MPATEAQIAANKKNAQHSTGPKTQEGKEKSRCNSLKHGLTGEGIVLTHEDEAQIVDRFITLEKDLAPSNLAASLLVQRFATLSVRIERSVEQEAASIRDKQRNAESDYDDKRMAEAEHLMEWILAESATNARRLRRTPEGIDLMIARHENILCQIGSSAFASWNTTFMFELEAMDGRKPEGSAMTRVVALCFGMKGDCQYLTLEDCQGRNDDQIVAHIKSELRSEVLARIEALREHRKTFDFELLALQRAEAVSRAIFDPSKEAVLARKYEAATERSMLRVLKELREIEADARKRPEPVATPEEITPNEESGSLLPEPPEPEPEPEAEREIPPRPVRSVEIPASEVVESVAFGSEIDHPLTN